MIRYYRNREFIIASDHSIHKTFIVNTFGMQGLTIINITNRTEIEKYLNYAIVADNSLITKQIFNNKIEEYKQQIINQLNKENMTEYNYEYKNSTDKVELKFKKLNEKAIIPKKATEGSAGMDVYATSKEKLEDNRIKYGIGLAVEIPKEYALLVMPRSSISNTCLRLCNSVGLIDSDYRGEIILVFDAIYTDSNIEYEIGERIGQLVLIPNYNVNITEVSKLSETKRGTGSYGSTGK